MLELTARPSPGNINTPFGRRPKPTQASPAIHYGQDYGWGNGKDLFAAADGIVVEGNETGLAGAYGNRTRIDHGGGFETWYCHQSVKLVRKGQRVKAGQKIGVQGATGNVTGVHLHFEVRLRGVAVDPAFYFRIPHPVTVPAPRPQEDTLSAAEVAHIENHIDQKFADLGASIQNLFGVVTREGRGPGVARIYQNVETGEVAIGVYGESWTVLHTDNDQATVDLLAADGFTQDWKDRKAYPAVRYEFARMLCGSTDDYDARQMAELTARVLEISAERYAEIDAEAKADDQPALSAKSTE
ncbi:M23 family metallopeptidase [Rathayibacter sp. VKM Ac-2630]|uniref:M23 family metallopeptidase n=1 Tax=Rathayibacter sp. VKM Ac-2630 TaxID=1938617 RepID=UPI0009CBEEF5|nr:M23 family metallopeptidase [Rathayibacter sp. VKM Ac-2630]OOB90754.1 hypothetical protein B0T42_10125 [Rathayibacter sp. VKM Ac-2630]